MNDEKYDYEAQVLSDVKDWIKENDDCIKERLDEDTYELDKDDLKSFLQEELWVADSVTGNASGSYFCNAWKAESALCHNLDLLCEALEEFDCQDYRKYLESAETSDVTIRCHLLYAAIDEAVDAIGTEVRELPENEIEVAYSIDENEQASWKFSKKEEIAE